MSRKLLVVATAPVDEKTIRAEVSRRSGDEDAEVRVVAPAADLSPLQWLANEEDDARGRAEERAGETAAAADAEAARVEASVGDPDPVQAIVDTRRDEDAGFLEEDAAAGASERFGLPVTHLTV